MNPNIRILSAIVLVSFAVACKSNTKQEVKPQPEKPPTEIAAPAEPARPAPEPPAKPFPSLPTDVEELNRLAREKGWIQDAFFAYDSNVLSEQARTALASSARWLKDNPGIVLTIEGHADERGTEQYNLALGERRAWAAREYLVTLGLSPNRVGTISYGEERPFAIGSDERAWSQNRRAHLSIRQGQ